MSESLGNSQHLIKYLETLFSYQALQIVFSVIIIINVIICLILIFTIFFETVYIPHELNFSLQVSSSPPFYNVTLFNSIVFYVSIVFGLRRYY